MRKRRVSAVLLAGCMLFGQTAWAADTDTPGDEARAEAAAEEETNAQTVPEGQEETETPAVPADQAETEVQTATAAQETDGREGEIPWDQLYPEEKKIYAQLPELEIWYMGEEHVPEDFQVVVEDESICDLEITSCAGSTATCRLEGKASGTTRAAVYYLNEAGERVYAGIYELVVTEKPEDAADIQDAAMNYALMSQGADVDNNGYLSHSEVEDMSYFYTDATDNPGLQIQDWSALGQMSSLNGIDICGYDMENLDFLESLQNPEMLSSFSFREGTLAAYSGLSHLTQLSSLRISQAGLTDLSVLDAIANRQNLSWLYVSDNQITDISALQGMDLSGIYLDGNPNLTDVAPLLSMSNLMEVNLEGTGVSVDNRWELAGVPDSITISKRGETYVPKISGPLGQDFTVEITEGEDTVSLEKEEYYDRYIVTGMESGSAALKMTWQDKVVEIPVTVTAPDPQQYYEYLFPGTTLSRWAAMDVAGCTAVSDNEAVCEVSIDEAGDTIIFSGKTPGDADISIMDGEGDILLIYHVTVREDQQANVYMGAPVQMETNIYISTPAVDDETELTVADPSVCKAELISAEQMDYSGNLYYTLRLRLEGLKEGETTVQIRQYGEISARYKVTVKELPEDAVQIQDENILSALLSSGANADINGDGYLTQEELDGCYYLNLQNCGLTDLAFLQYVPNLTSLDISGNQLTDLKGIEALTNLYTLYARNNDLTSIAGLEQLKKLETVLLTGNDQLTDISPLYDLERLGTIEIPESVPDEARWKLADFQDTSLSKGDMLYLPEIYGLFSDILEVVPGENAEDVLEEKPSGGIKTFCAVAPGETSLNVQYHDLSTTIKITVDGIAADQEIGETYGSEIDFVQNTILESSGQLWQLYPEVEKKESNVKEYAAGWIYNSASSEGEEYAYTLDNSNVLWDGEEKLAENVVKFDGRYALTEDGTLLNVANAGNEKIADVKEWNLIGSVVKILKMDGTLWTRSENPSAQEPEELTQIAEQVKQNNFYRGYLKADGTYWSYEGEKLAENVSELEGETGYYDTDGVYYIEDVYGGYIKTGVFRVKEQNWVYTEAGYEFHLLTEDNKLYYFGLGEEPELLAEDAVKINILGDGIWLYQTADGVYRNQNGQAVENATAEYFSIMNGGGGYDAYTLVSRGAGKHSACKNGVEILTNAVHIWTDSGRSYCLRTDGTIWDITEVPQMILDLQNPPEAAYVRGDADRDGEPGISDLRLVLRHVCGKVTLEGTAYEAADVTDDGTVGIEDLRKILRYVCGKIAEL